MSTDLKNLGLYCLLEAKRRLLKESFPRLMQCLEQFTPDNLWYRPNENTVSAANLVLHICGNAQQWIGGALGEQQDTRIRELEFSEKGPFPKEKLKKKVQVLKKNIGQVLEALEPEDLVKTYAVQGFSETGIGILIHVVEHTSYHVGQITYILKSLQDLNTDYYRESEANLNARNGV